MRETRLYCDRCGNEIPNGSDWVRIKATRARNFDEGDSYDLCEACYDLFKQLVEE